MQNNTPTFQQDMARAMQAPQPLITMLTDFGTVDGFIGVMKGVIANITPSAKVIDISHDLPAFSIPAASFLNEWAFRYFPAGTVHLCVVDPGVGTSRRVLIVETQGHRFVAPDNGLLTPIFDLDCDRIFSATNPRYWLDAICPTFHGRDIFSPVAAYVAQGVPLADMGEEIADPVRLDATPVQKTPTSLLGEIRYIDHFGNLISNIESSLFEDWLRQAHAAKQDVSIFVEGITIQGISNTYADKDVGNPVAVFDGYGRLEVAVRNGNAQQMTNGKIYSSIRLTINT